MCVLCVFWLSNRQRDCLHCKRYAIYTIFKATPYKLLICWCAASTDWQVTQVGLELSSLTLRLAPQSGIHNQVLLKRQRYSNSLMTSTTRSMTVIQLYWSLWTCQPPSTASITVRCWIDINKHLVYLVVLLTGSGHTCIDEWRLSSLIWAHQAATISTLEFHKARHSNLYSFHCTMHRWLSW